MTSHSFVFDQIARMKEFELQNDVDKSKTIEKLKAHNNHMQKLLNEAIKQIEELKSMIKKKSQEVDEEIDDEFKDAVEYDY